jgi:hypothetical protein
MMITTMVIKIIIIIIIIERELTVGHLVKKFPAFYGNRWFITMFKILFIYSHPIYLVTILVLSSQLRLSSRRYSRVSRRVNQPFEDHLCPRQQGTGQDEDRDGP